MSRQLAFPIRMVPMALVMGTIFFLSHQPGDNLHLPPLPGIDKLAHSLAYGGLAAATLFVFSEQWRKRKSGLVIFSTTVFCLLYGITDEFHQSFVPGRTPSLSDILADSAGAALVCLLWLRIASRKMAR